MISKVDLFSQSFFTIAHDLRRGKEFDALSKRQVSPQLVIRIGLPTHVRLPEVRALDTGFPGKQATLPDIANDVERDLIPDRAALRNSALPRISQPDSVPSPMPYLPGPGCV